MLSFLYSIVFCVVLFCYVVGNKCICERYKGIISKPYTYKKNNKQHLLWKWLLTFRLVRVVLENINKIPKVDPALYTSYEFNERWSDDMQWKQHIVTQHLHVELKSMDYTKN